MFKEERPWGFFVNFEDEIKDLGWIKILHLKKDSELSHQYHNKRKEIWYVVSGEGEVLIWENEEDYKKGKVKQFLVSQGDKVIIEKKQIHTAIARSEKGLTILEFGIGICEEDDIVRLKDKYGRS